MGYITALNGPESGRRYDLEPSGPGSILGRHPDCEIVVDVGAVSRQHAKIVADGDDFFVEDLQSRNGTYLNDERVAGRQLLRNGDTVRVCDVSFRFQHDKPTPMTEAPPVPARQQLTKTLGAGTGTVLIDDDMQQATANIMSKLDVSSTAGSVQLAASPEAKLEALLQINKSLGKALALDEVLPKVLGSLFKIFMQADRGFIVMRHEDGTLVPMWTKTRREDSDDTIRISRTIVKQVMDSQEAILSADAATDSRFEMSQSIADFRIRSMMCAPLVDSEGTSMGVLQIDTLDQAKRFQPDDLEVLVSVAVQAGTAIDNAQLHEQALRQRAIERDLEVSREVQRGFLPSTPPEIDGYEFFNYYQPADHVGGDYFDYIRLADGRIAVIVADVVGHGIAAALLMAKMSAEARFSLASESNPGIAVNRLNDAMSTLGIERFVTTIMTVLNPATHEVTVVNAGHMAPLHRRSDGSIEEPSSDVAGLPIGIMEGLEYKQTSLVLAQGESLLMYTDGVNECSNAAGEMYGIDRVRQGVSDGEGKPKIIGQTVIDDVRKFLGNSPQEDDMCLVCFGRR